MIKLYQCSYRHLKRISNKLSNLHFYFENIYCTYELNLQHVNSYKKVTFSMSISIPTRAVIAVCVKILCHSITLWIIISIYELFSRSFFQLCRSIILFCSPLQISDHYSSFPIANSGELVSFLHPLYQFILLMMPHHYFDVVVVVSDSPCGEVSTRFTITLSCAPLSNIGLLYVTIPRFFAAFSVAANPS